MIRFVLPALGLALCALGCAPSAAPSASPDEDTLLGLPLVYSEDFESGGFGDWMPADSAIWRIETIDGNHVLSQFEREGAYEPPVRSPFNRALLQDLVVGDFVYQARVRSTIPDYNHRDVVLIYGYQNERQMYYTHFGKAADPHAHSIFLVDDAPRVSIAQERTDGTPWDDDWHTVRIVRRVDEGAIAVYFDDMETPIMTAVDETYTWGGFGLGTFDDTAQFDDIRIWGNRVEP